MSRETFAVTVDEDAPFAQFAAWFADAAAGEPEDPNAMTLATVDADGAPSARIVLLKGVDGAEAGPARGFVFYTNFASRKGAALAAHPRAALLFHWKSVRRQVRIEGGVARVGAAEADAYFATRPRLSRLGAWASDQSRPLADRAALTARLAALEAQYPGEAVPRPPHWGGFRLTPAAFEFWQDMPFRLHERTVFSRGEGGWRRGMLFP